ncbi:MAG: IS91 family transposase [Acidobacteria bacterium]|nr:MAG: IS91 family transposase [Acidobacteriota bacterium]
MNRPAVEVADILRAQGNSFLDRHRGQLRFQQLKVMRAILRCRTAALGGHIDKCLRCGKDWGLSFNSCRDRHCPKCQAQSRQRWIAARQDELLATSYFHVVFTLPHLLNALIRQNPVELYNLLFRSVAETLMEVAANPKHLGAEIGFFAILHTWSQNLLFHPHIHCVVPSGGLAPGRTHWIRGSATFFLPLEVLQQVFRGKFVDGLEQAFAEKRLNFSGLIQHLAEAKGFAEFVRKLHRHEWVVYAKPSFGGPEQVLRYLGRYTHRVAISNHRLISFDGDHVAFRWRDYAHGNKKRKMTLSAEEFIRRFLLHVLPNRFVRIRHFGFMANYQRSASLDICRQLLDMAPVVRSTEMTSTSSARLCPTCHGPITVVERLNPAQLRWRFVAKCFSDTS